MFFLLFGGSLFFLHGFWLLARNHDFLHPWGGNVSRCFLGEMQVGQGAGKGCPTKEEHATTLRALKNNRPWGGSSVHSVVALGGPPALCCPPQNPLCAFQSPHGLPSPPRAPLGRPQGLPRTRRTPNILIPGPAGHPRSPNDPPGTPKVPPSPTKGPQAPPPRPPGIPKTTPKGA